MSATITIPADLERRIAGFAAAQGKNLQQIVVEALAMVFDPAEELEDAQTLRALESAGWRKGRPAKEVLEEIRVMLGIPADAKKSSLLVSTSSLKKKVRDWTLHAKCPVTSSHKHFGVFV